MTPPTIKAVRISDDRLVFELDGDREVGLALSTSVRLLRATSAERGNWIIQRQGIGVHWPDVDEDIAVWEVLGIPEDAYLRSLRDVPVS
jgi:hypothetical protein